MKKAVTGEGLKLVQCKGSGIVYCADDAKAVSVIELRKQTIYVNSPNVLALSSSLRYEFKLLSNAGMAASGLLSLKVCECKSAALKTPSQTKVSNFRHQARYPDLGFYRLRL